MANIDPAVFWSYAHEDDSLDKGAILRLANGLQAEFSLITGETLDLFVDRTGISWGDEWRARIDNALVRTTFFVALLSPRYFRRPECRRELLEFAAQAQSLGVSELLLPILYVSVPNFTDENSDEAVALAARMQYEDWTQMRLRDEGSQEHRRAVNALALRLVEVAAKVSTRQVETETRDDESADEPALDHLIAELAQLLPDWLDAVETDPVVEAQFSATDRAYSRRLAQLSTGPAGARLALTRKKAQELLPLVQRAVELAEIYSARTLALNPIVASVLRIIDAHPELLPLLDDLHAGVRTARARIRATGGDDSYVRDWALENAHVSRATSRMAELWARRAALTTEANELVLSWDAQLTRRHATPGD
jgi:hypothetical protein